MKYVIKARIEVDGIVDRSDIVGAIFGQTEGLFGSEFDLRDLQEKGRIGRIHVDIKHHGNKTVGDVLIPSNLDKAETALIGAMVETVDKVGPYNAKIQVVDFIDVRLERIKKIVERSKELLKTWSREKSPDLKEIINQIVSAVKTAEITHYGPERLPAGPDVDKSDTIIIVEGRADVINLLRYGYRNVIALGGAQEKVPESIVKLAKNKRVIAFVDGDRVGDMILRTLINAIKVDMVAKAPPGREVEELSGKEIEKALKNAVPLVDYLKSISKEARRGEAEITEIVLEEPKEEVAEKKAEAAEEKASSTAEVKPVEAVKAVEAYEVPNTVVEDAKNIIGTLTGVFYDHSWNRVEKVSVRDLYDRLSQYDPGKIFAVVFDGIVTQRLVDLAKDKRVQLLVGVRLGSISKKPEDIHILTINDIVEV